jgi:hypothetical protein
MGEAAFHAAMLGTYRGINSCNAIAPKTEFSEDELYFDDVEGKGPAGDIYSKGTWLLHSLQNMIGDEVFWRSVKILVYDTPTPELLKPPIEARLRSTDDFMNIVNKESGLDLGWFFEVYARRGPLPELSATDSDDGVVLEWHAPDDLDFPMPTPVRVNGEMQLVEFENNRALLQGVSTDNILIDPYMQVLRKLPIVPTCEERRAEENSSHGG